MGEIIKGKDVSEKISNDIIKEIEILSAKNIIPKLQIIRVGENKDDISYEKSIIKKMQTLNLPVDIKVLEESVSQEIFLETLKEANDSESIHGILIFRPLPKHLDENIIKNAISPEKDIDCLNPLNVGKTVEGDKTGFAPCTPSAVMEILSCLDIDLKGKKCAVIGSSMVVGKPVSSLLLNQKATVTVCNSSTKNIQDITRSSDIIIACAGVPRLVKKDWVLRGAVVVDVGINFDENGVMCGDVDFENVKEIASVITPVPGGVGGVTTSILAKHTVRACKQLTNNI